VLIIAMDPKIIGTIGLCFDIFGAFFVAVEVVKVYRGNMTGSVSDTWFDLGKPTPAYKAFETRKRIWMGTGLVLLFLGFLLQIAAIWMK
jgi:hypothetical protein